MRLVCDNNQSYFNVRILVETSKLDEHICAMPVHGHKFQTAAKVARVQSSHWKSETSNQLTSKDSKQKLTRIPTQLLFLAQFEDPFL